MNKIKKAIIGADIIATIAVAIIFGMMSCGCNGEHLNQAADIIVAAKPGVDAASTAAIALPGGVWAALAANIVTSIATAIVASRKDKAISQE